MPKAHPVDLIKEFVPRPPLAGFANALICGLEKHGAWDTPESMDEEIRHIEKHIAKIRAGEIHDEEDGQAHASSITVRSCKIYELQCGGG